MKKTSILLFALLLAACNGKGTVLSSSQTQASPSTSEALGNLQNLGSSSPLSKTRVSPMRAQALRDTALSIGARGGLAWRAAQINDILKQKESYLRRIFNFNAIMLDDSILPPVLLEGRNTLTLGGIDTIRIADRN